MTTEEEQSSNQDEKGGYSERGGDLRTLLVRFNRVLVTATPHFGHYDDHRIDIRPH